MRGGWLANRVSFSCMPSIPLRTMHAATLSYVLNGYSSRRRLFIVRGYDERVQKIPLLLSTPSS